MGTVVKFGFSKNILNDAYEYRTQFNNKTAPEIAISKDYQIPTVFVEMDDFIHYGPNNVSIFPDKENIIAFTEKEYYIPTFQTIVRKQIPLDIAFARTIHSAQGVTAKEDIVYIVPVKNFCKFLSYVALSRAGSLKQIHLLGENLQKHHFEIDDKTRNAINEEYYRLQQLKEMVLPL